MKTFFWLVKREYWEHRGGFLWAPLVAGGIFLLLLILMILLFEIFRTHAGVHVGFLNTLVEKADAGDWESAGNAFDMILLIPSIILSAVLGFVVLFYSLGSLYDDRRDRSILFWKSLPVSDMRTVLSKVASALIMAPVFSILISVVMGVVLLLICAFFLAAHGISIWRLLAYTHPLQVLGSLLSFVPLYALWALPSVGWLMFCSAWARSKPFLWGVAVPLIAGLFVGLFSVMSPLSFSAKWIWSHVILRALLSVFPGSEFVLDAQYLKNMPDTNPNESVALSLLHSYTLLGSVELWIGVAAGIALIGGAIWFRRVRDDS